MSNFDLLDCEQFFFLTSNTNESIEKMSNFQIASYLSTSKPTIENMTGTNLEYFAWAWCFIYVEID